MGHPQVIRKGEGMRDLISILDDIADFLFYVILLGFEIALTIYLWTRLIA